MADVKQRRSPSPTIADDSQSKIGRGAYMALAAALLGWMFDGAEMGIFSMVGRSAVKDLMPGASEGQVGLWFNVIMAAFLVGAATGGVLFGWLGDRIGRVRAMTLSVLTYALFTGLCGIAGDAIQVGILRFIAALGMGGEWSLGVALVMEVWPNRSRAFMAGLIGAAANVGYLIVGFVGLALLAVIGNLESAMRAIQLPDAWVEMLVRNDGWRVMMILGVLPALLTFFIRMFVPESEKWEKEKEKGSTSSWATQDLVAVLIGIGGPALIVWLWAFDETGGIGHTPILRIAGTFIGLLVALVGYTYPVIRFFQREAMADASKRGEAGFALRRMMLGACLSGIALIGTWGSTQQAPSWAQKITDAKWQAKHAELTAAGDLAAAENLRRPRAKEYTQIWLAIGAIVGTIVAALAGDWMGRRPTYFVLCALSLGSAWYLFLGRHEYGNWFLFLSFVIGAFTASFYGWLPLYLPELFSTNVRATGQGFSFNFGRILAAIGVLQVGSLLKWFDTDVAIGSLTIPPGHPLACSTICLVYLVGMVLIWFAPETHGKPLPE
jgi:MFS transporter, SHS family, sialic acid transporter